MSEITCNICALIFAFVSDYYVFIWFFPIPEYKIKSDSCHCIVIKLIFSNSVFGILLTYEHVLFILFDLQYLDNVGLLHIIYILQEEKSL
jgi:hypothetical protein